MKVNLDGNVSMDGGDDGLVNGGDGVFVNGGDVYEVGGLCMCLCGVKAG